MNKPYFRKGVVLAAISLLLILTASLSFAEDAWLPEFEDICSRTEESSAMNKDELKAMVERCDKLLPQIENSDNPQKRVYLFRLEKCKKLFMYVMEQ